MNNIVSRREIESECGWSANRQPKESVYSYLRTIIDSFTGEENKMYAHDLKTLAKQYV